MAVCLGLCPSLAPRRLCSAAWLVFSENHNVTPLLMGVMIIDYTTLPTDMCWKLSKYACVLEQQLGSRPVDIFLLTESLSRDRCQ